MWKIAWMRLLLIPQRYEFSSKSQLSFQRIINPLSCCWYHKGTNFQANHNKKFSLFVIVNVVADTTKVRIFKQITTPTLLLQIQMLLLLIPQRYEFSSKSQLKLILIDTHQRCCWYHKGTNFQANHNLISILLCLLLVVADTTKVRIFKQITTPSRWLKFFLVLLLIPQRYEFSSKSQLEGTYIVISIVVADTTKVRIFKQITTAR